LRYRGSSAAIPVSAADRALERKVEDLDVETDSGKLLALALDGGVDVLRAAAARQLSDPVAVAQASVHATGREVQKILLEKLKDKAVLSQIAETADDRPMQLAAAVKAEVKTWQQVFDAGDATSVRMDGLGEAVATASLFADVQREAARWVRQACVALIRRGDETHIPAMVDLLEGYGDTTLAEAYLNSGQPDLETAARTWADLRGYTIGPGAEVQRAMQRSGR